MYRSTPSLSSSALCSALDVGGNNRLMPNRVSGRTRTLTSGATEASRCADAPSRTETSSLAASAERVIE